MSDGCAHFFLGATFGPTATLRLRTSPWYASMHSLGALYPIAYTLPYAASWSPVRWPALPPTQCLRRCASRQGQEPGRLPALQVRLAIGVRPHRGPGRPVDGLGALRAGAPSTACALCLGHAFKQCSSMLSSGVGGFKWCQLQKLVPFHMQCPGCVVCLHARRHTHHHSTVQAIRYKPLLWPCCGVPEGQVEASCRTPAALSSYRCARAVGAPSPQRVRRLRGRAGHYAPEHEQRAVLHQGQRQDRRLHGPHCGAPVAGEGVGPGARPPPPTRPGLGWGLSCG